MKSFTICLALFATLFFSVSTVQADNSVQCVICNYIVPLVEGYLQNQKYSVDQIETALTQVCQYFGAFESQCDQIVEEYTQQIVKELVSGTPSEQICYQIYICSNDTQTAPKHKINVAVVEDQVKDDSLQCQICTYAVPLVEEYIKSGNYNESWIEAQLQSVCTFLPAPYSSLCQTMIQTYTSQIIQELENGTPADQVCQQLSLCTSSKTTPMMKIAPKPLKIKVAKPQDDSLQCQICEYAVPLVESYLQQSNYNTSYIESLLQQAVCAWLPSPYNTLCNTFVQTYTEQIIEELEKGTPADQVCTSIGLCVSAKKMFADVKMTAPQDNSIQCQICTYAVPLVEEYLQSGNCNETCIENMLDQAVCSWLPSSYSALCAAFVNSYTGPIIQELEKGTPADQVCQSLGLCTSDAKKPVKPIKLSMKINKPSVVSPKDDSLQCQICNYAVPLIEDYIQQGHYNTTFIEAQIQQIVCSWLPAPYNTLCNTFVQTYTEPIIDELEKGTPAEQVCDSLGLCVNFKKMVFAAQVQPKPQDDSLQCQICTYAVPLVEEYLKEGNYNETYIEDLLDQAVCSWLPAPYSTLCGTFINSYTGPIIDELEKGTPADQVCQSLALCTSSKTNNAPSKPTKQRVTIA